MRRQLSEHYRRNHAAHFLEGSFELIALKWLSPTLKQLSEAGLARTLSVSCFELTRMIAQEFLSCCSFIDPHTPIKSLFKCFCLPFKSSFIDENTCFCGQSVYKRIGLETDESFSAIPSAILPRKRHSSRIFLQQQASVPPHPVFPTPAVDFLPD